MNALLYGMGIKALADRLAITYEAAERLYNQYFSAFVKVTAWMQKQKNEGMLNQFVTTYHGRKVPLWDLMSHNDNLRGRGERLCVNAPVQGCLPADTRVLTRKGWIPIGRFEAGEVWTGAEWAYAIRLSRGPAERVRVHLSDGRTFDCDDRHKFLVENGAWPQWCHVDDLKGRVLVRDWETSWGEAGDLSVEDWYWAGRFSGDGCLYGRNQGYERWKIVFHRTKEAEDMARCETWLGTKDFATSHSKKGYSAAVGPGEQAEIRGMTPKALAFWKRFGWVPGRRGSSSIPAEVFTVDRERRGAFWRGRFDADGHARNRSTKVTTAIYSEAQDLLRLAQTLGMSGKISQPNVLEGRGADGSDHVFWEVYLHCTPVPLVAESIERLGVSEEMFTFSVDHERHAFSSEGLISKNTAADVMKYAMLYAQEALQERGWWMSKVRLVNNLHDALTFEANDEVDPADLRALLEPKVSLQIAGWPTFKVDWELGQKWGSSDSWADEKAAFGEHWRVIYGDTMDDDRDLEEEEDE